MVPSLVEKLTKQFWRRRFVLSVVDAVSLCHHYLPLEKGVVFGLNNFCALYPWNLCGKFG